MVGVTIARHLLEAHAYLEMVVRLRCAARIGPNHPVLWPPFMTIRAIIVPLQGHGGHVAKVIQELRYGSMVAHDHELVGVDKPHPLEPASDAGDAVMLSPRRCGLSRPVDQRHLATLLISAQHS